MAPNRAALWFGAILFLLIRFAPAQALTVGPVETYHCPVCRHAFEPVLAGSGTQTGMRLDFRPLGPIASPWPIPDCPKCHNVWFPAAVTNRSDRELQVVTKTVRSATYARLSSAPSYHRYAILSESLKQPARELAMHWLAASWQWESTTNRVQERACRDQCAAWLDRHLESKAQKTTTPDLEAVLLRADLFRRAGQFDRCAAWLNRWAPQPAFQSGLAPRIIVRQRLLIAARLTTAEPLEDPAIRRPGSPPKARPLRLAPAAKP